MTLSNLDKKWPIGIAACILLFALFELLNLHNLLPDISGYEFVQTLVSFMPAIGYVGLFAFLLIENTPIPFPGVLFLPLAGYYVFVGGMSFTAVLAVSSAASLIGSFIVYMLALKLGPPTIYWAATKLGISQGTLAKSEVRLCGRHGSAILVFSHFIPIFGSVITLPAGALRTNPLRFAMLSLLGFLLSSAAYLALGYSVGSILRGNELFLSGLVIQNIFYLLAAASATYIAYYSLRKLRQKRKGTLFVRKIEADEMPEDPPALE
jgi:membrane protein DedA with SNARE-associated domain